MPATICRFVRNPDAYPPDFSQLAVDIRIVPRDNKHSPVNQNAIEFDDELAHLICIT